MAPENTCFRVHFSYNWGKKKKGEKENFSFFIKKEQ